MTSSDCLYARVAIPYSYKSGNKMEKQTSDQIVAAIMDIESGTKAYCLAPVVEAEKDTTASCLSRCRNKGLLKPGLMVN